MAASSSPPHVVIFPFMAQGHTLPLLDISKALSFRGLQVTIITTPLNAPFIHSKVSDHVPSISVSVIPFPIVPDLPQGCENTAHFPCVSRHLLAAFITATEKMKQPFEALLTKMVETGSRPICVISDFFLYWTLDTCRSFDIPRVASHGMGVLPMLILKTFTMHFDPCKTTSESDVIELPSLTLPFSLSASDLPVCDPDDPFFWVISEVEEADKSSWGVIVNSFQELEGEYVTALQGLYYKDAKAWCVGPVLLYDNIQGGTGGSHGKCQSRRCPYIEWLDKQDGSDVVIYVSFGTQARLSKEQMDEIAYGLEMAGERFLWVVGSSGTWGPDEGWARRVEGRGLVVRDWVDQRSILAHPKVGGFLSHCGWNSVLESLSMGVPILAWAMGAEQPLNAKLVTMGLKAGLMVSDEKLTTIGCRVICDGVKELMGGEKARRARERAAELGTMARRAVEKDGSSDEKFDELIERLIAIERH